MELAGNNLAVGICLKSMAVVVAAAILTEIGAAATDRTSWSARGIGRKALV